MTEQWYGAAGVGRSGDWTVEVDSDSTTIEGFALSISGPRFYLQTPTVSVERLRQLLSALEERERGSVGHLLGATLSLEFLEDRLFFRLLEDAPGRTALLELWLSFSELDELIAALREAYLDAKVPGVELSRRE